VISPRTLRLCGKLFGLFREIFDRAIEIYNSVRNRKLADMFKEVGLVEKYGSGIRRIVQSFKEYGLPVPRFQEISNGFMVTMFNGNGSKATGEVTGEVGRLLPFCRVPKSRRQLMVDLGLKHEDYFRAAYLTPALEAALIEMTIPDKPKSRLQKYRLTALGEQWVNAGRGLLSGQAIM
jgi:ATP-dependent DNA helicase RecG